MLDILKIFSLIVSLKNKTVSLEHFLKINLQTTFYIEVSTNKSIRWKIIYSMNLNSNFQSFLTITVAELYETLENDVEKAITTIAKHSYTE